MKQHKRRLFIFKQKSHNVLYYLLWDKQNKYEQDMKNKIGSGEQRRTMKKDWNEDFMRMVYWIGSFALLPTETSDSKDTCEWRFRLKNLVHLSFEIRSEEIPPWWSITVYYMWWYKKAPVDCVIIWIEKLAMNSENNGNVQFPWWTFQ